MFKTLKAAVLVCVLSAAVMAGDMNGPTYTAPPPSSLAGDMNGPTYTVKSSSVPGDVNGPPHAAPSPSGSSSLTTFVVVDLILAVLNIR